MTIKQQGGIFGRNPSFNNVEANDVDADSMSTRNLIVGEAGSSAITPLRVLKKFNGTTAIEYAGGETSNPYADIYMAGNESLSIRLDPTNSYPDSSFFINHNGSNRVELEGSTSDLKVLSGNLVIGTSGKGIDFSATSGTGTSELFSDYEEGTWTPVIRDASSGGNTGGGSLTGYYTKIGNIVFLTVGSSNLTTVGMTSGNDLFITGLPFSVSSNPGSNYYTGAVIMSAVATTGNIAAGISDPQDYIRIYETVSNSGFDYITVGDLTSGSADIRFTLIYEAS
tara:strand:+ start:1475 stop:2320 length:846 start_codon:yes stop_codon:yes gene_type:complete